MTLALLSPGLLSGYRAPLAAGLVALFVSWLCTPLVRSIAIQRGAIDDPSSDDRRVHKEPIPRWGGVAIYLGFLASVVCVLPFAYPRAPFPMYLLGLVLLGGLVVVMGALDDLFNFPARIQMLILLGVGVAIQFFSDSVGKVQILTIGVPLSEKPAALFSLGLLAIPATAFYIFIVTKTMDTIDGLDGLAAGIATISATTLTAIAAYGGQPRVAILAAAVAGASLGFLRHNYNPAKIFMGTGGAQFLGFSLACLSVVGALKTAAAVAVVVPMFAFGVPLIDAVVVVIRRLRSRVPITQADKRHVHHTLLGMGLSQKQAVLVLYAIAATLCGVLLVVIVRNHG